MSLKKIMASILVTAFVSGCATSTRVNANKEIDKNKNITTEKSDLFLKQSKNISGIKDTKKLWVSGKEVKADNSKLVEESWISKAPVTFNLGEVDIKDAVNAIMVAYPKLKIKIDDDVFSSASGNSSSTDSTTTSSTTASSTTADGSIVDNSGDYPTTVRMLYNGMIPGLLDKIASDVDISWVIDKDGDINFYRFDSKTFKLNLIAGTSNSSSGMDSGGKSGAVSGTSNGVSNGGASMSTSFAAESDPFNDVVENVRAILSSKGTMVALSGIGTITIRDTPSYLKKASNLIDKFNKSLTSQIVMNVKVYSVKKTNADSYGLNWDLFYGTLKNKFSIALATVPLGTVGGSVLTSTVLNPSSSLVGSKSIIEALSTLGNVSIVTETKAVTVDNISVPINQSRTVSYISEVTPQTTNTNGTTVPGSITPGSVTTGFNMLVTPKIISNGQVMMQFAIDMSEMTKLVTRSSGGMSIQTPEVSRNTFLQRAIVKSGQTLIMTGFNKKTATADDSGIGSSSNWALGGSKRATTVDEYLVVIVSPKIIEGAN